MTNWLNNPAVKALLPHLELLEEAFGMRRMEREPLGLRKRAARRLPPRDLATRRGRRLKPL